MDKKYFKKLKPPDSPGIYFFKKGKDILYIGKATSLKDRIKSYFGKDLIETRGPVLLDMLFHANKIDWQATDSVLEALILEAELIKKNQPKYNTKEKSDKSFNYVCITKPARRGGEELPKVLIMRGKNLKKDNFSKTYGPFTNGGQLKEALKIIRPIFPFLDDKSKNYLEFYKQVFLVPDILTEQGIKQYKNNIKNLKLFFEGKKKRILQNLEKEMKEHAKKHKFEIAGEMKRQIFSLKHINDIALLKNERTKEKNSFRIEAYDIAHMGGKNMVGVMTVVEDEEALKHEYKKFSARGGYAFGGKTVLGNSKSNDVAALREVLERRLTHSEWTYPNLIVVDGAVAQMNVAENILKKMNLKIKVVAVVKDERHKPKSIMGDKEFIIKYKKDILLANSEAHRFAIAYHKNMRAKNFLR